MTNKPTDIEYDNNDTSDYLREDETMRIDFNNLFSHSFSNIVPLYISPNGHTEIHSAIRYGKRFILKGLKKEFRNDPINNLALAKEFEIGIFLEHSNIRRTHRFEVVDGICKVIVLD